MAEINKLSVGQALDKLRRPDVPESKQTRLHEKMDALDEDIQRMRATRRRLERNQRAAEATGSEAQGANERRGNKSPFSIPTGMVLAIVGSLLVVLIILYATLVQ
jgi:uncharacterized protein YhaN